MPYKRENYNFYIITVHHCGLALINAILVCFTNYSRSDVFAAKDGKNYYYYYYCYCYCYYHYYHSVTYS